MRTLIISWLLLYTNTYVTAENEIENRLYVSNPTSAPIYSAPVYSSPVLSQLDAQNARTGFDKSGVNFDQNRMTNPMFGELQDMGVSVPAFLAPGSIIYEALLLFRTIVGAFIRFGTILIRSIVRTIFFPFRFIHQLFSDSVFYRPIANSLFGLRIEGGDDNTQLGENNLLRILNHNNNDFDEDDRTERRRRSVLY